MNKHVVNHPSKSAAISTRLLIWSFSVLVLAGILAAAQLAVSVRKEMRELVDANLMQYASSLYMLEQQVQGYGHVSEPLNLDKHNDEHDDDHDDDDKKDKQHTNPSAINALKYIGSDASANSLAKREAILLPGAKKEVEILLLLPMTNVTAIVSPIARPNPRKHAPIMP